MFCFDKTKKYDIIWYWLPGPFTKEYQMFLLSNTILFAQADKLTIPQIIALVVFVLFIAFISAARREAKIEKALFSGERSDNTVINKVIARIRGVSPSSWNVQQYDYHSYWWINPKLSLSINEFFIQMDEEGLSISFLGRHVSCGKTDDHISIYRNICQNHPEIIQAREKYRQQEADQRRAIDHL